MSAARWLEQPSEHPAALLPSPASQRVPCRAAGGFTGRRCPPSPSPEHPHGQHSGLSWSAWGQDPAGLSSVLSNPSPGPRPPPSTSSRAPCSTQPVPGPHPAPAPEFQLPLQPSLPAPLPWHPRDAGWRRLKPESGLNPLSGTTQPPPDGPWQQFLDSPMLAASSTKLQVELALAAWAQLCPPSPASPLGALGQRCLICASREP